MAKTSAIDASSDCVHLLDGATQCGADSDGILDGAFGVPANSFGDVGEIGRWRFEVHADMCARWIGAALVRHVYLMRLVVVVGSVVIHDHQHRDVVLDRHPERAQIKH